MPLTSPPERGSIRPPHPLALRLIAGHNGLSGARVLDFGTGSGRNAGALRGVGFTVVALPDGADGSGLNAGSYAAALSTHALLHGTADAIARCLRNIHRALETDGKFYATFGSIRDARLGTGTRLAPTTYAPDDGDERGVAHTYFDEHAVRALLKDSFDIVTLEEVNVDTIAGTWAHATTPLRGAVHWFVEARKS